MKALAHVTATPEQLRIVSSNDFGAEVICGAAGSGKTSTALLRLRSLAYMFAERRRRLDVSTPLRILVLTFNRTLAGYVRELASRLSNDITADLTVDTFSHWAMGALGYPKVSDDAPNILLSLSGNLPPLTAKYVAKEAEYLLGRFDPLELTSYLSTERTGRGTRPRVEKPMRQRILDSVVAPYLAWLARENAIDWNGLALLMGQRDSLQYDVVVIDESQDFSAGQLRAVKKHLSDEHSITFVIDTIQRVYARGFTWAEAGFNVQPHRSHRLLANYRNTAEIAKFTAGILRGINPGDDGALPNLQTAVRRGPPPYVLRGQYNQQLAWVAEFLKQNVDLSTETVAFLQPQGGRWFKALRAFLRLESLTFVELTREPDWPQGEENIALCTFFSAKGLEFDHVFVLGLNSENTMYDDPENDDEELVLRKLLAIAVARARKTVTIGYKVGEESKLVNHFEDGTFVAVDL